MRTKWNATAIVLAGGKNSRIGSNKALLEVEEQPLIQKNTEILSERFKEVIISGKPEDYSFLPYRIVEDEYPGMGPMMGIYSALSESLYKTNFIIACDIPEIDPVFLEYLIKASAPYEITVPVSGPGLFEPLFGIYKKSVLKKMNYLIENNIRKISRLFALCKTGFITMEENDWYHNINTKQDFQNYLKNKITS